MNRFVFILFSLLITNIFYSQDIDPNIKKHMVDFLIDQKEIHLGTKDEVWKLVNDKNQAIIYIEKKQYLKDKELKIYSFFSTCSHCRRFLLLQKNNEILILGKEKITSESNFIFSFFKYNNHQIIDFFEIMGKDILFVYKDNLYYYESNITVD